MFYAEGADAPVEDAETAAQTWTDIHMKARGRKFSPAAVNAIVNSLTQADLRSLFTSIHLACEW